MPAFSDCVTTGLECYGHYTFGLVGSICMVGSVGGGGVGRLTVKYPIKYMDSVATEAMKSLLQVKWSYSDVATFFDVAARMQWAASSQITMKQKNSPFDFGRRKNQSSCFQIGVFDMGLLS